MTQQDDSQEINKLILTTGIRVGTQVRTKFMRQFTAKTSDDGLYRIDLDLTLARITTAAKFIQRVGIENLIVYSGREHATTSVEKFCEVTGATKMTGRFMPGTLTNPSLPYYIEHHTRNRLDLPLGLQHCMPLWRLLFFLYCLQVLSNQHWMLHCL